MPPKGNNFNHRRPKNNNNNNKGDANVDPAVVSSGSKTEEQQQPTRITTGQGALEWFKAQQQQQQQQQQSNQNNTQQKKQQQGKGNNKNNSKSNNNNANENNNTNESSSIEALLAAGVEKGQNKKAPKSYADAIGPTNNTKNNKQQQAKSSEEAGTGEGAGASAQQQQQQTAGGRGGRGGGRGRGNHFYNNGRGGGGGATSATNANNNALGLSVPAPHSNQNTSLNVANTILQSEDQKREMEEWNKYMELGRAQQQRVVDAIKKQEELTSTAAARIAQQQQRLDLPHILDVIEQHDVTFICTDTGSGKSTTVPHALLTHNPDARIASSQPRRTATMSIASHVAKLRGTALGDEVGYWIRGEKRGDDANTRIWYMTSYTLLLHLLGSPLNPPYTHIILDEFHERQPDIEVTVALCRLCLKRGAKFKLIIMSATLNTDEWEDYFAKDLSVAFYKQSEPDHPIHNFFAEDICPMVGQPMLRTPVNQSAVDTVLVDQTLLMAQYLIAFLNAVSRPQHAILVFLPGRAQVDQFQHWIESTMANRIEAIPWHGSVDLHVIEQAILKPATYRRQKVYLATDIAEVSITLPDVVFVVDLALVKRPQINDYDPSSVLFPPLAMTYIGRSNIMQRRGRVGRTQQGFYFCMAPKTFVNGLPQFLPPPVHNSRIDELALHCLQLASNPVAVFSLCRGQPSFQAITASMRTLCDLGCILPKTNKVAGIEDVHEIFENSAWSKSVMEDAQSLVGEEAGVKIDEYVITFVGRLLQLLPVNVQAGMLVFYGLLFGLESIMTLAAACAASPTPFQVNPAVFNQPQQQQGGYGANNRRAKASADSIGKAMAATEASMKSFGPGESSDLLCVMFAVIEFRRWWARFTASNDGNGPSDFNAQTWCSDNNLSWEKLMAIVDLDQHIKYELSGFMPFHDVEDAEILSRQLQQNSGAVMFAVSASFASQALLVTNDESTAYAAKEGARGLFTELRAKPDLHAPSCIRWGIDEVIVPVSVSLRFNHLLAGYSTKLVSTRTFFLSVLLLAYKLNYASFEDDNGKYHEFAMEYLGQQRVVELDDNTARAVLDFRKRLSQMCAALRLRFSHKDLDVNSFEQVVQKDLGFSFTGKQAELQMLLTKYFMGAPAEKLSIVEIEKGEEEIDEVSLLSFALPASTSAQ